jgi:filamentous hemagglutinin family protein
MKLKSTKLFDKQQLIRVGKRLCLSTILFLVIPIALVEAQVTPDESLSTNVEQQGENQLNINGGEREGNNLFHSFEEFSVPEGIEAVFENALDIENIFTRITGESASAINGILKTQGDANFFLVNPNGIVFGENAQLDVGGSFMATTANSVQFEDGTEFIASQGQEKPILTVSVPIGLNFEGNNGTISVNGDGLGISDTPEETTSGLSVQPDQTLALVGSRVQFNGGTVKTAGGRIELGSIGSGLVKLEAIDKGVALNYENNPSLENIQLSNSAAVDASGEGGGDVQVTGRLIKLEGASQIEANTLGAKNAGSLNINASEALELIGVPGNESTENTSLRSNTREEATGDGGNIKIDTGRLTVRDDAVISASSTTVGNAGSIEILARDSVYVARKSKASAGSSISTASIDEESSGNAGNLSIETGRLTILDGGVVSVATFGKGAGGNLSIRAKDSIEIVGESLTGQSPSRISAKTEGTGKSGDVFIETRDLSVREGAIVNVGSEDEGTGDAGILTINAEDINLDNSGSIIAISSSGTGGNININTDNLQIDENSSVTATADNNGDGGNITINTTSLIAKKNSEVTANAFNGRGGNIDINAEGLFLFDSPSNIFSASSELGIDGEIQINTPDINFQKELEQSELEILTTQEAIASSCLARSNQQGSFTINNGSGMPRNPNSNYSDTDLTLTGMSSLPTTANQPSENSENQQQLNSSMLPAERMVKTENGRVFLVAAPQEPESLFCPKN